MELFVGWYCIQWFHRLDEFVNNIWRVSVNREIETTV